MMETRRNSGMTVGDGAFVRASHGADGEPMELSNTAGTGDQGDAAVTNVKGEARVPVG